MLIGDKTGPAIIAHTYGDVRPDHLLRQAQRIRLTVQARHGDERQGSTRNRIHTSPDVSTGSSVVLDEASASEDHASEDHLPQGVEGVTLRCCETW